MNYDIQEEPIAMTPAKKAKKVLVVGGGVSGMTAALELARQGFKVHLLEREKQLGGNALKLHYLPSGDDPTAGFELEWRKVASAVDVHVVPGRHLTSITQHVQVVAEHLKACLENAHLR